MSAETTAKVLTRMLENKLFRTQVASDPQALAQLDLTDEERKMLVGTAYEGVDKLLQPASAGGWELGRGAVEVPRGGAGRPQQPGEERPDQGCARAGGSQGRAAHRPQLLGLGRVRQRSGPAGAHRELVEARRDERGEVGDRV
jgi:hypothetical protein